MANLIAAASLLQFYGADFLDKQHLLVQTIQSLHFVAYFQEYVFNSYCLQSICLNTWMQRKRKFAGTSPVHSTTDKNPPESKTLENPKSVDVKEQVNSHMFFCLQSEHGFKPIEYLTRSQCFLWAPTFTLGERCSGSKAIIWWYGAAWSTVAPLALTSHMVACKSMINSET